MEIINAQKDVLRDVRWADSAGQCDLGIAVVCVSRSGMRLAFAPAQRVSPDPSWRSLIIPLTQLALRSIGHASALPKGRRP